jgi:hypothetical protein
LPATGFPSRPRPINPIVSFIFYFLSQQILL